MQGRAKNDVIYLVCTSIRKARGLECWCPLLGSATTSYLHKLFLTILLIHFPLASYDGCSLPIPKTAATLLLSTDRGSTPMANHTITSREGDIEYLRLYLLSIISYARRRLIHSLTVAEVYLHYVRGCLAERQQWDSALSHFSMWK